MLFRSGIGAAVRVGSATAWGAWREVHGGGGYWSQDSSVPVVTVPGVDAVSLIEVRWPGGKVTAGAVPAGSVEVEVSTAGLVRKTR